MGGEEGREERKEAGKEGEKENKTKEIGQNSMTELHHSPNP